MKTLVVAPHADDELLGCGGTLIKRAHEGHETGWLLVTSLSKDEGWDPKFVDLRLQEINKVRQGLNISSANFYSLTLPTAKLDEYPIGLLVKKISKIFKTFAPSEVLLPYPGDVHSDHRVVFEASCACTKWFRYPSIKRVLTYETISETEYGINPVENSFRPNLFINIENSIDLKLSLLEIYATELSTHPFPRSLDSVRALALLRGSQMGANYAEAFQILRQFE